MVIPTKIYNDILKLFFDNLLPFNLYAKYFIKKYIKYAINTNSKGLNKNAFFKLKLRK